MSKREKYTIIASKYPQCTIVANKTVATEITSVEVPTGKVYLVKIADKVVKIGM